MAILIVFFKRDSLRHWFIRNRFPNVGKLSLDSSLDGLIFTISHCEVPLWMIRNNQPKAIGLMTSSASLANAKIIKDEAEKSGIQVLPICEVFNADNPIEKDWTRYSSRQQSSLKMGGFVGDVRLNADDLGDFWELLYLGQYLNLGKGCVMGLGRYSLSFDV